MRKLKLVGALALLSASSSAMACDLDGMGEHRFFAFSNMVRGGPAAPADSAANEPSPGNSEQGDNQAEGNSDERSKPVSEQSTAPSDNPPDGATFR